MNWLRRHMVGRYGRMDQLNVFLFVLFFIVSLARVILNFIFHFQVIGMFNALQSTIASTFYSVLFGLQIAAVIIIFMRLMSRNIQERAKENQKFLNRWYNLKDWNAFRKRKKDQRAYLNKIGFFY